MFDVVMSLALMMFFGGIIAACAHMVIISCIETWRQPYARIKWKEFNRKEAKYAFRKKTKR